MTQSTKKPTKEVAPDTSTNTLAIVGFILAFLLAPLGIILSAIALNQINKTNQGGKGLAVAGLVVSIFFTLATIAIVAQTFSAINNAKNRSQQIDQSYRP